MLKKIIGRIEEKKILKKLLTSKKPEFLAIFGRRRIGKTYLIKCFFSNKACCYFQVTGIKNGSMKEQLYEFTRAVEKTFYPPGIILKEPETWMKALEVLTNAIDQYSNKKKIILFFDELPWLATKRARILEALDYYWNTKWSDNTKICLIVCGSAASWIINNVINSTGGLHNRITAQIRLDPFSLKETKDFLKYRSIILNEKQILSLYLVMGGVPHYLNQIEKGLSAPQNIDKLCFSRNGLLYNEFNNLISSLFNEAEMYKELIRLIASQRNGIERSDILVKSKSSSGGRLNARLAELEQAGFIISVKPYGHVRRGQFYRIIDEYILFYLDWIEPISESIRHYTKPKGYWDKQFKSPRWRSWSGYAFESVCYKHITNIREALNIPIAAEVGSWRFSPRKGSDEKGAQIDLLFDRDDDVVTICEIKYSDSMFTIDKEYANNLMNKIEVYKKQRRINKQTFIAMITSSGLKQNSYSKMVTNEVILADFFKQD